MRYECGVLAVRGNLYSWIVKQLTSSCKRALATAIGGFSNSSPELLFKAGDCHMPIKVMQAALAKTQAELADDQRV